MRNSITSFFLSFFVNILIAQVPAIQWEKCLVDGGDERSPAVQQMSDAGYIGGEQTFSNNGNVSGNHGDVEFWIVKLNNPKLIKAELIWDKSFTAPQITPKGVAADGVARLYLKVTKTSSTTASIQNVTVRLMGNSINRTNLLGKVYPATQINGYSLEANAADTTFMSSSLSINGEYWFWYVAPEDFSDSADSQYTFTSEREITVRTVASFSGGEKDSLDISIKIVRPPLVLVHGLAGKAKAWDNFTYNNGIPFVESSLWKQKRAISISPHSSFAENAENILSPDITNYLIPEQRLNTLQGNIEALRSQGYACNQVDYVCHSMGGCVMRTAITVYRNKFFSEGSSDYKNYARGYIHKAITLNTPHDGSPIADAVTEYIPEAPKYIRLFLKGLYAVNPKFPFLFDFIEPVNFTNIFSEWQATLAVKDLQVSEESGGKKLLATEVKHHLIASDINLYSAQFAASLADLEKYMVLLDQVLKVMHSVAQGPTKVYLKGLLALERAARIFTFTEWYSQQKGYPGFLSDGDWVVPLKSQLAGLDTGVSNITIFNRTNSFNAYHGAAKSNDDVGTRTFELLNTRLSSSAFGSTIPQIGEPSGNSRRVSSLKLPPRPSNTFYDTTKVKILSPATNSMLPADSMRIIVLKLKDTVNLVYVDLQFQGNSFLSVSRQELQNFAIKVDSSFLGKSLLSATAVYDRNDTTYFHTDTLNANVFTNATLQGFNVDEGTQLLQKAQPFTPTYTAIYTNYGATIPLNHPNIGVAVITPSLIQYNAAEHNFNAIADTGSASAIITYEGFKDTINFTIIPQTYSGCINRTTGSTSLKNSLNWERNAVPSTCDSVVVMPGHTLVIDSSVRIRALTITSGGSVTLNDPNVVLRIGEADDGNKILRCNGNLNIQNGKLFVNGLLHLTANSNFSMTDGELVLDGNTGFIATSVPDSNNIFDVSNTINSFSFSGGTLQIIDPPLGLNSQAINCSFDFGDNSVLKFGDGVSQTKSNNPKGFGGNLLPSKIGKLILDAATKSNNRIFINSRPLIIKQTLEVKSGNFVQNERIQVSQ